jgi:hypothetical protein
MRSLFPVVLLVASLALAQTPANPRPQMPPETRAPAPVAQAAQDPGVQKAKALIQQMIQALGGQAYLSVQDMQQQGRTYGFYHGESAGTGAPFWRFWKWPDRERLELTKQRDWIIIYSGDQGYEITFRGTAALEAAQLTDYLRRREYSLEWVLHRWINEPGVAYFYDGFAIAERKPAEKVTIMNAKAQAVTLYISQDNHLPLMKTFTWRDQDRQLNEEFESWDNYRPVQGVMTPFSITRGRNGETVNQRFINTVTYNQGLPDSMFAAKITWDPTKEPAKKK